MTRPFVLAVDDEQSVLDAVKLALKSEPYEIITTLDPTEGLALCRSRGPEVVLLDLKMPGIDGLAFLKQMPRVPALPCGVIMITGHGDQEDFGRCFELGATGFLKKPFGIHEIKGLVKAQIDRLVALREQQEMEVVLRESERKYRNLFEFAGDALFIMRVSEPEGALFADCNESTLRLFGCTHRDEIIGKPPEAFSPPVQPDGKPSEAKARELAVEVLAGRPQLFEWEHRRKDGTPFQVEVHLSSLRMKDEILMQAVVRDITDRKKAEEETREMARLKAQEAMHLKMLEVAKRASIGQLATGMAHEINQPLTYISGFLQGIYIEIEEGLALDPGDLALSAKRAQAQVGRISTIIDHLRIFARADEDQELEPIPPGKVLDDALRFVQRKLQRREVKLTLDVAPDLPPVLGVSPRLTQVLLNLFENATQALSDKRTGAEIQVRMFPNETGDNVLITFSDNGEGIDPAHLDRIFDPFFTTRPVGQGTGLGLSIAYGIVQEHKGSITCRSELSEGTVFTISLPAHR